MSSIIPAMDPTPETAGWQEAHIGLENDGLEIDGVGVWEQPWRSVDAPPVDLPHPAHPRQTHHYRIHEVGDPGHPIRFAACELSNGVWGFYVPLAPVVESHGVWLQGVPVLRHDSPDGTIRVDLVSVEWSNSHWVNSPQVIDNTSGRIVLDLSNTDWDATVAFPGPRRVRLGFRRYLRRGTQLAAELDLAGDTVRLYVGPHRHALPDAPLADIARALEAASLPAENLGPPPMVGHGGSRIWKPPAPWAAWRAALAILVIALIAIAAAMFCWMHFAPEDKPRLDSVPAMPK